MIITQTPLRISFAGGGTDFEDFYKIDGGCVVSSAIDKYIYVVIKERFDRMIRVGYSKTEMVDSIDDIEHELVRECLRKTGITQGIEISTMADIPSEGSGLGSSSSVTVGLLNALYAYRGDARPASVLAEEACEIEIGVLGKPIGKQDQYIAAFGNMRFLQFMPDGEVKADLIEITPDKKRRLGESLILFYTGITRSSSEILSEQRQNIQSTLPILQEMKRQAFDVRANLSNGCSDRLGLVMHEGWMRKKELAGRISSQYIDELYNRALRAGSIGGKIAGAGGGGFLLLYCPPEHQTAVRAELAELQELPFNLERDGTKVIFNVRR
ncbi:MAG TPA: GHMP kinase [Armatimonadota bacterium]|jgi:D-glycero-alpha-D-manno-heptose-7-phosphate kinase